MRIQKMENLKTPIDNENEATEPEPVDETPEYSPDNPSPEQNEGFMNALRFIAEAGSRDVQKILINSNLTEAQKGEIARVLFGITEAAANVAGDVYGKPEKIKENPYEEQFNENTEAKTPNIAPPLN